MSHIATIDVEIKDLSALKSAVAELGCKFVEGKKEYVWFGISIGDYPLPKGMTKEQLGTCSHVIQVPGVRYEIGVVKQSNGNYTLAYDFFGYDGYHHDGHKLLQKFGDKLGKLTQMYGVHKATAEARKRGLTVSRVMQSNGAIKLQIGGYK